MNRKEIAFHTIRPIICIPLGFMLLGVLPYGCLNKIGYGKWYPSEKYIQEWNMKERELEKLWLPWI